MCASTSSNSPCSPGSSVLSTSWAGVACEPSGREDDGVGEHLRYALQSDAETIARYHRACWLQGLSHLLPEGVVAATDPAGQVERWRGWLRPDSDTVTVVVQRGDSAIAHTTIRGNELVNLFVDPDYWGQGLGRGLLAVAERMLAQAGNRTVELHTLVGNTNAIALYTSAGWIVTDRFLEDEIFGVASREHVLTKVLECDDNDVTANRLYWDDESPSLLEPG